MRACPNSASGIRRAGCPDLGAGCAGQPLINETNREGGLVMSTFAKTAILSVTLLTAGGVASSVSAQQSALRDRVASAIESVESACAADAQKYCGDVSKGEGRILLCMQAHDDQLGI